MKTIKTVSILSLLIFAFSYSISAQDLQSVKIKTSAQTELCKEKIENTLAYEKGVKDVELNLKTKVVTVKYNESKTNYENLLAAITKIGYNADDVKADKKAYSKLPDECKKSSGSTTNCSKTCSGHK